MGSVSVDIYKKEREYKDLTLSDENVVKYLILHRRSLSDVSYGVDANIDINQAGNSFDFNQELITLYASMDKLLLKVELKERDGEFLKLLFDGHSISDIIEDYNYPRKTAYRTLDRIVTKIVDVNDEDWKKTLEKQGLINQKETLKQ